MMPALVIDAWQSTESTSAAFTVLPDGCRDLICRLYHDRCPQWYISPLFDRAVTLTSVDTLAMVGYRLKPGAAIDEDSLLATLGSALPDTDSVALALDDASTSAVHVSDRTFIEEAMALLATRPRSVEHAARQLGVSSRTLQSRVVHATARTPGYWLMLARVRHCARNISAEQPFIETALDCGFVDQPHMNREFRRWFNATPTDFLHNSELKQMILMPGFGNS